MSYPGHNVDVFIKWYILIMKKFNKIKKSKNTIVIKYENFILNNEFESKKLLKFLRLKSLNNKNFNINNSKKNIFKALSTLNKKELYKIEKKLKEYLQWPQRESI